MALQRITFFTRSGLFIGYPLKGIREQIEFLPQIMFSDGGLGLEVNE